MEELSGEAWKQWRRKCREVSNLKRTASSAHDKMVAEIARAHDQKIINKQLRGEVQGLNLKLLEMEAHLHWATEQLDKNGLYYLLSVVGGFLAGYFFKGF